MKQRILHIFIALAVIVGSAQAQTLSVQPVETQAGGQTEVVVNLTGATSMTALQFNLKLPTGLNATTSSTTLGAATDGHTLCVQTLDSGDQLFILYSMDLKTFKDGELLRIPVAAGNEAVEATGKLYTIRTATAEAVSHPCADASFDITVKDTKKIFIETDLTSQFAALTKNTNWKTGAGGTAGYTSTEFCPMVKPSGLPEVQMCEFYETNCNREGDILYQTMMGLPVGTYNIELYGGAAYTFGRGFSSDAFTGDGWKAGDKIESETGVQLYATTSEGTYGGEIPIYYATNFPEGAAVMKLENVVVGTNGEAKIGLSKTSHSTNWHIIQLKSVVATVNAVALHGKMVADANAALTDEAYQNVIGTERTALENAVNDNATVSEQTSDVYQAAIDAIQTALNAFTDAKSAYDTWQQTKNDMTTRGFLYATAAKKATAEDALKKVPSTATEAGQLTASLFQTYRQYAESSAMLEGVESSLDVTATYIQNPKADEAIDAAIWKTVLGEGSGGSISILSNEPWTDGNGSQAHKYFDGGNWGSSSWDVSFKQDITLPAGKYQLTVLGRSANDVSMKLFANETESEMAHIGASGGLFDRGWEQSSIEFELKEESTFGIGVRGVTSVVHNWMSFSDFRLVKFDKATTRITQTVGISKENCTTYDLQGRRVVQPTKGLYITGGKKIIIR